MLLLAYLISLLILKATPKFVFCIDSLNNFIFYFPFLFIFPRYMTYFLKKSPPGPHLAYELLFHFSE